MALVRTQGLTILSPGNPRLRTMRCNNPLVRLLTLVAMVLSLGAISPAAQAHPAYQTTQVAPGLYSFGAGMAFNAFMITDDGVIVMDSFDKEFAEASLQAIRQLTDKPIRYLVYSHNHYDHISGGEVFKAQGATVLSHEAAANWLKSHPSPDVVMPDKTWSGSRYELKLGHGAINLLYFGANHGEGMTVFQFPHEHAIYTVDLVVPKRVGFAYMPDFSPREWERTLAEMGKLDFDQVMYAHNAAVGPRASVAEQLDYLRDLRAAILAELNKGTPFMKIPNTVKLPKYEKWDGYEEWLPMNAWRVLLEIAMGV
ncbi:MULTISPECIES: MBL fold metallo-hydrolase [Lysobacter]|uniref:MBL fold metallo-hydrolase n=1 Tax=Lysobacter TaxID=68 RepID=UPI001F230BDC|nr:MULTISPECIES: MBL fold metallo-hydrolase [Lysobacter]UJB19698.1 MBL fold metallo-hydrolase [Lysobacter capsici]UJQ26576.1 MBL fold metallo-hydrolase [Lysobacter gummosus]